MTVGGMFMEDKITCNDVLEYEHLFNLAPSFLLKRMARKNTNVVKKFHSQVESYLNKLDDTHKQKLDIALNHDAGDLQALMAEAYQKTRKKQYKILADPNNRGFVELNMAELKKLV